MKYTILKGRGVFTTCTHKRSWRNSDYASIPDYWYISCTMSIGGYSTDMREFYPEQRIYK